MKELITVIINVYNREKFIGKCIESVINQTYKNLEILIVNDGSTDNTLKICESYKDERIKIITTENMGLSMSRNVGIENSKGEYLYFVDSDDFIENDVIEYLYKLCKKYNVSFSTCLPLTIFDYNYKTKVVKEKVKVIDSYEMLKKIFLGKETAGTIWNKLIKKELFNNIRFENRIINDTVVTHKVVINAKKIAYSNQVKYYYLKHSDAVTVNGYKNLKRSIDLYNALIERYEYVKKLYPNFLENDIGLLRCICKLYMTKNEEMLKFLDEQNASKYIKQLFSYKILFAKISLKLKILFVLIKINPKLCRNLNKKYQHIRFKYKI